MKNKLSNFERSQKYVFSSLQPRINKPRISQRENKTVLITGITGFVGSHLAEYILEKDAGIRIIGLTRWRSPLSNIFHIKDKVELVWGDLCDMSSLVKLIDKYKPDIIFHLAAQSYVDFSFVAPLTSLQTNVIGTANLLETIR